MSFQAEITFTSANELVASFFTYLCKKSHKRLELGPTWPRDVESCLSKSFVSELKETKYWEDWGQLQLLVWKCPNTETAAEFLHWFERLSAGEIYEHLSAWVKQFPHELGAMRDRVVYLLSEWDRQYFSQLDPAIVAAIKTDAQKKKEVIERYEPGDFIEFATNGVRFEPVDELHKVLLIPQYHSQPVALLHAYEGITICQYASSKLPMVEEGEPPANLYRMVRSLADKTRLKILRFLSTDTKSFMEVVQHMGMAKSTIYEHMLTLRSAGLIRGHVVGTTTISYSIRKEAIGFLHNELNVYLY